MERFFLIFIIVQALWDVAAIWCFITLRQYIAAVHELAKEDRP
jgi:hypothetical protein